MSDLPDQSEARSVADARRARWLSLFGAAAIRLLGATWRIRFIDAAPVDLLRRGGQPVALMLWHGQLLPLLYAMRNQSIASLISTHKDGELVAQIALRLGCRLVRGSSSRGAERALLGLSRALQDGFTIAVTPDGPRGPYRSFAPGALVAAYRARAPVVAFGVHVNLTNAFRTRAQPCTHGVKAENNLRFHFFFRESKAPWFLPVLVEVDLTFSTGTASPFPRAAILRADCTSASLPLALAPSATQNRA